MNNFKHSKFALIDRKPITTNIKSAISFFFFYIKRKHDNIFGGFNWLCIGIFPYPVLPKMGVNIITRNRDIYLVIQLV